MGLARAGRARGGPRARALTCAGISAETVALAAAAGTQADESNQTFALVREKPQAAGAVVLIYSGRDRRACAWAPASLRRRAVSRPGSQRAYVGSVSARETRASRGRQREEGLGSGRTTSSCTPLPLPH